VPRKVAKSVKSQAPASDAQAFVQCSSSSAVDYKRLARSSLTTANGDNEKGKAKAVNASAKSLRSEDYAFLIYLALSDYALWSDPDLRRAIEQQAERFIPLGYLLRHASILKVAGLGKNVQAEETVVLKALRTHANGVLDVRMMIEGSSSGWHAKDCGLYEVRRNDWESMLQHPSRGYTRDHWERRTVYLVLRPPLSCPDTILIDVHFGSGKYTNNVQNTFRDRKVDVVTVVSDRTSAITNEGTKYHSSTSSSRRTC